MRRRQVPQFISSKICPRFIKTLVAEFLSWFVVKANASKPFLPVINDVLTRTKTNSIINIELGVGGGIETITPFLNKGVDVKTLPIDEFNTKQSGLYLFVNSFHQLPPDKAKAILEQIADSGNPIVAVEGNNDSLWQIVGMTVFVPLTVILSAPFVKPFRLDRLLFTYIIPILPLIILFDGCAALMKLYNPADLKELTSPIKNYRWEYGKNDNRRGGKIIYLKGEHP